MNNREYILFWVITVFLWLWWHFMIFHIFCQNLTFLCYKFHFFTIYIENLMFMIMIRWICLFYCTTTKKCELFSLLHALCDSAEIILLNVCDVWCLRPSLLDTTTLSLEKMMSSSSKWEKNYFYTKNMSKVT